MIIGVLQQKGGVGKSTLALNLAACFALRGQRVLFVDADPQGTALAWSSIREAAPLFPVIGMAKPTLHKDLPEISRNYDVTIIDGAPRVNELARSAILACDKVLIPVQPSPFDVWSCTEIVRLIQEAQQFKDAITAAFVINRRLPKTVIARDVVQAFAQFPYPLLSIGVGQRVVFAESAAQGLTVMEAAPASEASREISALAELLFPGTQHPSKSSIKEKKAA